MRTTVVDTSLRGLTVLVTNATTPIGSAIVQGVINRAGRCVIHYDRNEGRAAALLEEIGNRGWILQADLSRSAGVVDLWAEAHSRADRVYAVVNNVCVRTGADVGDRACHWYEVWERDLCANLVAPTLLGRAVAREAGTYGDGRVITVISPASRQSKGPELLSHEASEAALIAATRSIAADYGAHGTSAVAITTGLVDLGKAAEAVEETVLVGVVERVMACLQPDQRWMNGATFDHP